MVKYASAILFFTPLLLDATTRNERDESVERKQSGRMGGGRGAGGRVEGVGIGGYSGARTSPPFLPNIIVIAGRVAAFPRTLGVTIIIEVEQDDREMRQLSHYSFDGGYHGGTVRWSPSPRYSWMVHLNISKVFSGRYMVMSLSERSLRLSRQTLPMIFKMKYR